MSIRRPASAGREYVSPQVIWLLWRISALFALMALCGSGYPSHASQLRQATLGFARGDVSGDSDRDKSRRIVYVDQRGSFSADISIAPNDIVLIEAAQSSLTNVHQNLSVVIDSL